MGINVSLMGVHLSRPRKYWRDSLSKCQILGQLPSYVLEAYETSLWFLYYFSRLP